MKDDDFLAAERRVRGRMASQPGFISRELGRDDKSGEWLLLMRFETREQMDTWMTELKSVAEMHEFGSLIDWGTMTTSFFVRSEP